MYAPERVNVKKTTKKTAINMNVIICDRNKIIQIKSQVLIQAMYLIIQVSESENETFWIKPDGIYVKLLYHDGIKMNNPTWA